MVECKNWSSPVGSQEVSWFDTKIKARGLQFGILMAGNGITGSASDRTAAHQIVAMALTERRRMVVITTPEIQALSSSDDLVVLVQEKLCELAVSGGGTVRGHLLGGCLEVLQWLRGTSLWPDASCFDGAILFLETSEEGLPPRAVARELRVYAAMGLLPRLAAILFGRPGGRIPVERFAAYDDAILKVVRDEEGLGLPVVTRMDFGHTAPTFVVPYGVMAEVDCNAGTLAICENAVTDWRPSKR